MNDDDDTDEFAADIHEDPRNTPCDFIEPLEDENEDAEATCPSFEIVTIPADFTVEGLVSKYEKGKLKIPGFQRGYVWNQKQASRLIESLLLGLPVPSLFLYTDPDDGAQQVIDGQQRLLSVVKFYQGSFSNATLKKPREFKLIGLGKNSPYADCTVQLLRDRHPVAMEKLNDAVMRAFIIKQNNLDDATSAYYIFERLNTGGTQLIGQEIRNCIYHGPLNDLLRELNKHGSWRRILGAERADGRMRDIELILRVVSLLFFADEYRKPMKDFLSTSMRRLRHMPPEQCRQLANLFTKVCDQIVTHLGEKPFHQKAGMNPAIFDAVFTTIAKHNGEVPDALRYRYRALVSNRNFFSNLSRRTTDAEAVAVRLRLAEEELFGI
jgi:hypothetical protein